MIKWLETEVSKIEKSGTNATRFSLLGWATTIYASVPSQHQLEDSPWLSLSISLSTILYVLLDPASKVKTSMRNSILVSARRAIRIVSYQFNSAYSADTLAEQLCPYSDMLRSLV